MSYIPERSHHRDRVRKLENLQKQVNNLEVELKGRHRGRDWEDSPNNLDYIAGGSSQGNS